MAVQLLSEGRNPRRIKLKARDLNAVIQVEDENGTDGYREDLHKWGHVLSPGNLSGKPEVAAAPVGVRFHSRAERLSALFVALAGQMV